VPAAAGDISPFSFSGRTVHPRRIWHAAARARSRDCPLFLAPLCGWFYDCMQTHRVRTRNPVVRSRSLQQHRALLIIAVRTSRRTPISTLDLASLTRSRESVLSANAPYVTDRVRGDESTDRPSLIWSRVRWGVTEMWIVQASSWRFLTARDRYETLRARRTAYRRANLRQEPPEHRDARWCGSAFIRLKLDCRTVPRPERLPKPTQAHPRTAQ
jgi:hypothetical protein